MINIGYVVVDLHVHLRSFADLKSQLNLIQANLAGIGIVVYMPNTEPCLDNPGAVNDYHGWLMDHQTQALPTSAITIGREGKTPVDVEALRPLVVAFTDDGNCLEDLDIFKRMLEQKVLLMVHCEPETEMVTKYLEVLSKVGGLLHIQHVSLASTVAVIRAAKKSGLKFTAETCPHYCYYANQIESHPVNPPLGEVEDMIKIREAFADGTLDVIASDYAPLPRPNGTGFASFRSFIPLCYGLVLDATLNLEQLKEKLHDNPLRIIASGNSALLR